MVFSLLLDQNAFVHGTRGQHGFLRELTEKPPSNPRNPRTKEALNSDFEKPVSQVSRLSQSSLTQQNNVMLNGVKHTVLALGASVSVTVQETLRSLESAPSGRQAVDFVKALQVSQAQFLHPYRDYNDVSITQKEKQSKRR